MSDDAASATPVVAAAGAPAEQTAGTKGNAGQSGLDARAYGAGERMVGMLIVPAVQVEVCDSNTPAARTMGENVARIIEIDVLLKDLKSQEDVLELERKEVEEALMAQFSDSNVQNVKAMGRTVYLNRSIYCSVPAENMPQVVAVLDAEGLSDVAPRIATTARIKALIKEDEQKWKERFGELVSTGEIFQIRTRGA